MRFYIRIRQSHCISQVRLRVRGRTSFSVEQTFLNCPRIPWESCENGGSDAGGLGWSLRLCISNSLPGGTDAARWRNTPAQIRTLSFPSLTPVHALKSRRPSQTYPTHSREVALLFPWDLVCAVSIQLPHDITITNPQAPTPIGQENLEHRNHEFFI